MSQQQTTTQNAVGDAALPVIRIGVVILHLLFLASLWYSAWFDKLQHPKLPTLQVTLVTLPETILADQIPQGPDMAQPPPPDAVIEAAPLPEPAAAIEPVSPDVPDHVAGVEAVPPPPVEALPPPAPEPAPPPEPVPPPEAAVVPEPAIVPEPAPPLPPEPKPEPIAVPAPPKPVPPKPPLPKPPPPKAFVRLPNPPPIRPLKPEIKPAPKTPPKPLPANPVLPPIKPIITREELERQRLEQIRNRLKRTPGGPRQLPDNFTPLSTLSASAIKGRIGSQVRNNISVSLGSGQGGATVPSGPRTDSFFAKVTALLYRQWQQPSKAETGNGRPTVLVSITVLADGTVQSARITGRSGVSAMDGSVSATLLRLNRLPALPPFGITSPSLTMDVTFELTR